MVVVLWSGAWCGEMWWWCGGMVHGVKKDYTSSENAKTDRILEQKQVNIAIGS